MISTFDNAQHWLQTHQPDRFTLTYCDDQLTLFLTDDPKLGGVTVDFTSGTLRHRRQFGGGRGEAIAKAVGVKGHYLPNVLDATAGLGRDAFVLAMIGCHVTLFERHPVVFALLEDGLRRAQKDPEIGDWVAEHLHLMAQGDLSHWDPHLKAIDVVYLDPMFPHKQKSALVKKEMRIFQSLVGEDADADRFLEIAQSIAKKRVVVKRPDYAGFLADKRTSNCIRTKSHRFDLYPPLPTETTHTDPSHDLT